MDNLEYWNKLCRPPEQALKTIRGGRLKGMSDINPQWRIKVMTEAFGPVGFGWAMQITKQWTEVGAGGEVAAFANVEIKVKVDGEWSEPFPGTGGSMLIAKETGGLRTSDEAFKMAVTDAISTALKLVGVAADIYMGMFDGSKYTTPAPGAEPKKPQPQPVHDEFKAKAEALLDKYSGQIAEDKKYSEWVDACVADGFYADLYNNMAQRFGK